MLIVGGDSSIGSALNNRLLSEGYNVTSSSRRRGDYNYKSLYLDLQDRSSFLSLKHLHFDAVVLCGGITSIQECEKNPVLSRQVNVDGTLALANLLADSGCHLLFLSTNMVFDGSKPKAQPFDIKNPITEYGRQKAEVEDALLMRFPTAVIIRFGKVLRPNFPLFIEWVESLRSGKYIHPYANRAIAPISLALAVEILSWLIAKKAQGVFQATAEYEITYAEAAFTIAQLSQGDISLIKPIKAPISHVTQSISTHSFTHSSLAFSAELLSDFNAPMPAQALQYALSH